MGLRCPWTPALAGHGSFCAELFAQAGRSITARSAVSIETREPNVEEALKSC
jgi:hypothetical protein